MESQLRKVRDQAPYIKLHQNQTIYYNILYLPARVNTFHVYVTTYIHKY